MNPIKFVLYLFIRFAHETIKTALKYFSLISKNFSTTNLPKPVSTRRLIYNDFVTEGL